MKTTIGDVRLILREMQEELTKMENAKIVKPQAMEAFQYFKTELDKRLAKRIDSQIRFKNL